MAPAAVCDGIATYYEIAGDGPPLLLFSPGGFNATVDNWRSFGIYRRLGLLDELQKHFTCIAFDKRESGRSGGRVEQLTWEAYAHQGAALLDHLEIDAARVMGGCIGCSIAVTLGTIQPGRVEKLVLYSPAGGETYRLTQHARFKTHYDFVLLEGMSALVELARKSDKSFAQDPRIGPWASVVTADLDRDEYLRTVSETVHGLFDKDAAPGPDAERLRELEIPALVVPGNDPTHATSAAQYFAECLPLSEYWDVMPDRQTADNAPRRILEFLQQ